MNERFKQLADNATHYANGVCDADANADWYETRDQKFGELIVQECADIALKKGMASPDTDFRTGSYVINQYLLTRFGVEE